MVSSLWVLKQFAHPLPTRPMVGIFWKNLSIHPPVIHQVHGGYFLKVPTTVPSGNYMGKMGGFFHNSLSNEFAPKFEHSFWVLSQYTHQCDHNVPSGFFSKNSQRTHTVTQFWGKLWVLCEFFWKEPTGYIVIALVGILWKNSKQMLKFWGELIGEWIMKEPIHFAHVVSTGYCCRHF